MKHHRIGDVMTSDVISVPANTTFKEVAHLLAAHRISGLPVVDDDEQVIGVISETDLITRQARQATEEDTGTFRQRRWRPRTRRAASAGRAAGTGAPTAGELMSVPPITVRAADSIIHSARVMARHNIERLPVLDEEQRLVGIVTRRDLLRVFLRPDADIREEVIREVLVRSLWLPPQAVGVRVEAGLVTLEGRLERDSEVRIAERMTAQIDGVVAVVNHLTARLDDSDVPPVRPASHGAGHVAGGLGQPGGVTEEWLRKL